MDIEQFYDADPRRRESEEIEFGREWSDANGVRTELAWVADTGELYAMAEPVEAVYMDPVGDIRVGELPIELVTVDILGVVTDRARLDQILAGLEAAMGGATASSGCGIASASSRAESPVHRFGGRSRGLGFAGFLLRRGCTA